MTTRTQDVAGMLVRPMRHQDLAEVAIVRNAGFHALDLRTVPRALPEPTPPSAQNTERWITRTSFALDTDPAGSWVAETDAGIVGFATSTVRELTWLLHTYVVRPGHQGRGIGRAVLEAALTHSRGCSRGALAASADPAAARRYRNAGFTLHPQMHLTGVLDRSLLPAVEKVRDGSTGDFEWMDSLDRQLRGSAHGVDHEWLTHTSRLVVSDTSTGSGYAYVHPDGGAQLLAASTRRTATRLLWECLAGTPEGGTVSQAHVTAANEWAVDVGMAARLSLHQSGYLGLRGMAPPTPYLHHGVFG